MRIVTLTMCLLAVTTTVQAQERPLAKADLPRGVEARLNAIIENPATRQLNGAATIADTVAGDVVAFKGPMTLAGRIEGELIVVEGNVDFQPGATVTGDVTVINGEATGLESANIGGTVTMYGDGFKFFHRGEKVFSVNSRTRRVYRDDERGEWGHSRLVVRTGWNYNRVEGLPVQFGPGIMTSGRNPTHVQALAIWRTAASGPFSTDEWGYDVRAEQFLGGHRNFRVGASLRSVIDPIEDWQMGKSESSLSTFVLHNDNHDYFQREGWSAFARYAPRATGLTVDVEYSDEDHSTQAARDPWTLFDNSEEWRLQPLVAEGRLRTIHGAVKLDRRNHTDYPTAGFIVRTELTHGLGGLLAIPATYNPLADYLVQPQAIPVDAQFTNGLIDARVYRRVGLDATLSLRAVGTGTLGNQSLPPQFQHALGGVGSLPGYSLFAADCGARTSSVVRTNDANKSYFPYYGCDRTAMLSAEYRGGFDFHFGGFGHWDDEDGEERRLDLDSHPNWILFFDAGRGWARGESKARGAADTGALYDAGAGIVIGDVGIYGAVPLTGSERGVKFFVRIGPRF